MVSRRVPILLTLALAAGCTSADPTEDNGTDVSLYALVTTVDGVSFGPPLGPTIAPAGAFDPTLASRLQVVLETTDAGGRVSTLATFDRATTPSLVLLAAHELYFANLPATRYFTDPALAYRFRALLDGREIGRSDMTSRVFEVMSYVPTLTVGVKLRIETRGAPVLTALSPATAVANAGDLLVTLAGSSFTNDSVVRAGGQDLATSYVSATELTATVPAALLGAPGAVTLTVFTPAPGGGSASLELAVVNGVATLTALSPAALPVGSADALLTLDGADFQVGAAVDVDGTSLLATFVSASRLVTTIPASLLQAHGTRAVRVVNPSAAPSGSLGLAVTYPIPLLNVVAPNPVTVGTGASVTLTGKDFQADSTVRLQGLDGLGGRDLATTYVSGTQLAAVIPADVPVGAYFVSVYSPAPGGGTSVALELWVEPAPQPDFTLQCSTPSFEMPAGQFELLSCYVISNRGYEGTVSFSCSTTGGLPCTPPSPLWLSANGYPFVFFMIRSTSTTPTGPYSLHLEATDGTITRTHDTPFVISAPSCGTPPAPELLAPADDAEQMPNVATGGTVSFDWTGSSEAGGYALLISDTSSFASPAVISTTGPHYEGAASYLSLRPGKRYYWKVYAYNYCHSSDYSPTYSFVTAGEDVYPTFWCGNYQASVVAGASTSVSCGLYGTYGWTGSAVFACDPTTLPAGVSCTFDPPSATLTNASGSVPVTVTLRTSNATPTTTSWVVASAVSGPKSGGAYLELTVNPCGALSTPTLSGPADNATNTIFSPGLFWNPVSGASSYSIQVATDAAFTNVVRQGSSTTSSWTVQPGLSLGTTYYWRVAANSACYQGAYSAARRLTTTANAGTFTVACAPTSLAAAQGGSTTTSCTFTSRNNFANTVTPSCSGLPAGVTCAFNPTTATLTANGARTLAVTVSASGTAALGNTSPFVVGTSGALTAGSALALAVTAPCVPVASAPLPISPADGATNYFTATPGLSWTPVAHATSYTVQVASDPSFSNLLQSADSTYAGYGLVTPVPFAQTIYWRARAANACSASDFGPAFRLTPHPAPAIGVSCSSAIVAARGALASTTCTATSYYGFAGAVTFGCSGLPAGVTCEMTPSTATLTPGGRATATLTVSVDAAAALGTSNITASVTAGSLTANAPASLVIE